ncbi:hypothetical protein KBB27_01605 [Patescibacteria group bacterium]|nr:hypothetical protein [Patescibacteria group bacterium]
MALPPSNASLGSTVGKRLFGTSNASVIKRKIESIDKKTLSAALKAQGIRGAVDARKVTQALTGEGRGLGKKHMAAAIKAMKEVGVTQETASMGTIMAESTHRAQQDETYKATGSLRPNALSLGQNATIGSRIAAARMASEGGEISEKPLEQARSIKEIRETLRSLNIVNAKLPRPGYGKRTDDPTRPAGV